MQVIIVSCHNEQLESFWQKRFSENALLNSEDCKTIVIQEDWRGGAGNGLGTLYAYLKAREKGQQLYGFDIWNSSAIFLYHTVGLGKRMSPLSASEHQNKAAIRLPYVMDGQLSSILEAVILQTKRVFNFPGRLNVYWSDQIFLPSIDVPAPKGHVRILAKQIESITPELWKKYGLEKYGILIEDFDGQVTLLEKIDYKTFLDLQNSGKIPSICNIYISLGSFSLSKEFVHALVEEFSQELYQKKGKLETDYHFWMPLTFDELTYLKLIQGHGNIEESKAHYSRMMKFKEKFFSRYGSMDLLGVIDIGMESNWWDFGNLYSYFNNNMKMTKQSEDGIQLRNLFNANEIPIIKTGKGLIVDDSSIVFDSEIQSGQIKNCLLFGVKAKSLHAENCLIINSELNSLEGSQCLLYNVSEQEPLTLNKNSVRSDVILPNGEHLKLYTQLTNNGKADWDLTLPQNSMTYHQVYEKLKVVTSDTHGS